jgi:NAD(P)-dependent dehydrogenase (short-subunit alcohol dehydrogenase family)
MKQMNAITDGTLIITGPTGGLGKELALSIAKRPNDERPDLLFLGRAGKNLTEITEFVRRAGTIAYEIPCDLSALSDVRVATKKVKALLADGKVRPLRGIAANAGIISSDTRRASKDGYELTFAVNYLAHAQLINDLMDVFVAPARIVLVGSNTYWENRFRKMLHVPPAKWKDPLDIAKPAPATFKQTQESSGIAYSNSKLAILYYAHELQRHTKDGVNVVVFEPGYMPGSGLARGAGSAAYAVSQMIGLLPGVSKPTTSGPMFASVLLDEKWSHLHGGDFVVKDKLIDVQPFAIDRDREKRLWNATEELLKTAAE